MRLPPLNALRAFESAARHSGYIAAAEELCVTRGAISRHVKILEEHLGVQLFHRNQRGVVLTHAGRRLLPVLSTAFGKIADETARMTDENSDLRIICPPTLSIRWLFPKLDAFRRTHPDIRVRLTTDFFGDQGFDGLEYDLGVSVEHWPGRSPDVLCKPLFPMRLSPACAPHLLEDGAITHPGDLARFTLLHEAPRRADWTTWLTEFGVGAVDPRSGEVFPNMDMASRAAVMGSGVMIADLALCREEIELGTLILPFPQMVCGSPDGRYALIGPEDKWELHKVKAFRDWLESSV